MYLPPFDFWVYLTMIGVWTVLSIRVVRQNHKTDRLLKEIEIMHSQAMSDLALAEKWLRTLRHVAEVAECADK